MSDHHDADTSPDHAPAPDESLLTQGEIWLRTCRPDLYEQFLADRTAALRHPGREAELDAWLTHRSQVDAIWEARQAEFRTQVFVEFMKELERPLPPRREVLTPEAERVMAAWRDPKIFDEVMAENRRLNAAERERQLADPLPLQELRQSAAMQDLIEEFRVIVQVEGLDVQEAAAYLGNVLREAIDIPQETPESHYPPDATKEQKAVWQRQENDPRQVAVANAEREHREQVEMPQRASFPAMDAAARQEMLHDLAESTESLSIEIQPRQEPPKIKL